MVSVNKIHTPIKKINPFRDCKPLSKILSAKERQLLCENEELINRELDSILPQGFDLPEMPKYFTKKWPELDLLDVNDMQITIGKKLNKRA